MTKHRVASDAVAEVLAAVEAGAVDRNHRQAAAFGCGLGNGVEVIALQRRNAGRIDEHRGRPIALGDITDCLIEAFLAAPQNHVHVAEIGGHADPVQVRAA